MAITGAYTQTCSDCRSGGMPKLYLIPEADLNSMAKASTGTSYATITLGSGKKWFAIDFEEDTAHWNETVEGERGLYKVTEEIEIFLAGLGVTQRDYLEDLLESSPCGMVGVVQDGCGVNWVVGYTDRFGKTRPLKVVSINTTTAKEFNDPTAGSTVVLRCTSNELAHKTTATIVVT